MDWKPRSSICWARGLDGVPGLARRVRSYWSGRRPHGVPEGEGPRHDWARKQYRVRGMQGEAPLGRRIVEGACSHCWIWYLEKEKKSGQFKTLTGAGGEGNTCVDMSQVYFSCSA